MSYAMWGMAAATLVSGYMSSQSQKEAASGAATAQTRAARGGITEQQRQFDTIRELLGPFVTGGRGAFEAQQAQLGLLGPEAQQAAITGIEESPMFEALTRQGEEAILQRASATGGLRGGNVQAALGQFRPQMLQQMLEQRFAKLGGLAQMGQASAAGVGAAGQQTGLGISQLLQQAGQARSAQALAQGQADIGLIGAGGQAAGLGIGALMQPSTTTTQPNLQQLGMGGARRLF